ncbi:MAG TPA: endonuclease/exonuclease/phosphatase family protein [Quisquiliibacterium sp.]|nr:endonuclease/exonuclease/phosphatase family protein [Quisquiliibacterium sp.]
MKLVTWNVQWFCGLDGRVDVARVVDTARAMTDFDVLCLQEVAVGYPGLAGDAGFDQPARLASLLPGFSVVFGAATDELGPDGARRQFGNLIATRLPVLQVRHHPLPWPADPAASSMPRLCTVATLATTQGPVRVMTTHLEYFSGRQRHAQAQALLALHREACALAEHPPKQVPDSAGGAPEDTPFGPKPHTARAILCGDFNSGLAHPEYALLQSDGGPGGSRLVDAWRVAHPDVPHAPTFRVFDKRYGKTPTAFDFVFVSEGLAPFVRRVAVNLETRASDHQPVLLDLADPRAPVARGRPSR